MIPDLENLEARQDADRREQEAILLALFLGSLRDDGRRAGGLMNAVANRVDSALSLGADPYAAAADLLAGNVALGIRPAAPRLAAILRDADVAGYRRTVRVIGTEGVGEAAEVEAYAPATDYASMARQLTARLLQYVQTQVAEGIRTAALNGGSVRRAVADSFTRAGLVISGTNKAWMLEERAETIIGVAFGAGFLNGWYRPGVIEKLTGFRFSAVLDSRTTDVCRACDGVKLPLNHPWLLSHQPPLHHRCRSVLLPMWREFKETAEPPYVHAPMAGFGHAPAIAVGLTAPAAA